MWIFTVIGFFSIVQKPGTDFLTVRTRAKGDLDALRERYLPSLSPTAAKGGTDYPWRATVDHAAFAEAMKHMVLDVTYDNYKSAVASAQGKARAHAYHDVWAALLDLPEAQAANALVKTPPRSEEARLPRKTAYGGVVVRSDGTVLLREPRDHFDGYVWTFAKGKPNPGESPEAAALREVLEETGVEARILAPIVGDFTGSTTVNRYFLMAEAEPGRPSLPHDWETFSLRWVRFDEAKHLIGKTTNPKGRKRDLAVLEAALTSWRDHKGRGE
jgi:8-oxo-dGTP pyrophosphatase MutT (NUDIX family)